LVHKRFHHTLQCLGDGAGLLGPAPPFVG
jgi:hypothetical protein